MGGSGSTGGTGISGWGGSGSTGEHWNLWELAPAPGATWAGWFMMALGDICDFSWVSSAVSTQLRPGMKEGRNREGVSLCPCLPKNVT